MKTCFRRQKSYLYTKTGCCEFIDVSNNKKLSGLTYKIRRVQKFHFNLKRLHYKNEIENVANDARNVFTNVLEKFKSDVGFKRKHQKRALYDVNSSKLTKKQRKEFEKNQLIIKGYKVGMSINDLSRVYRTSAKRVKE